MAATASVSSHPRSLAELDRSVSLYLYRRVGSKLPRWSFMLLEHSGNGVAWLLLVPALWLSTVLDASTRSYVANFFLGLWIDLALVGTLKGLVRRPRPVYNHSGDFVLVVSVDKYSFPSGHAARVAFVAAYTMLCMSDYGVLPCILVSFWALLTAVSRALMGRHYIGDVATGLVTGLVTTAVVTKGSFSPAVGWLSEANSEALFRAAHERISHWFKGVHNQELLLDS